MQDVLAQLQNAGLELDHFDVGIFRRCRTDGDKGGKKSGWYVLHELQLDSGDRVIVGACGNWKRYGDESIKITFDAKALTMAERERLQAEQQRLREKADEEKNAREAAARDRAIKTWPRLRDEGSSEYLDRKRVHAFGVKFMKGAIVVPVRTFQGLVGLQFIDGDGTKRFLTGTAKRGAFHVIHAGEKYNPLAPVVFVEGYATAASIHMATQFQVVVCFDAGNLAPVTALFRARYPEQTFFVAADNDAATAGNPGITKAFDAARQCGSRLLWPVFADGASGTDFNDLHALEGIDAVRAAFVTAELLPPLDMQSVSPLQVARQQQQQEPPPHDMPPHDFDLSPAPSAEASDIEFASNARYSVPTLLQHFWLVYGTKTCWDDLNKLQMELSCLRHAVGKERYKGWDTHNMRKRVMGIKFEPSYDLGGDFVNLFDGFICKPNKKGKAGCARILDHIYQLCGRREEEFNWLLSWIAYPLQHPGAKMASSVVMYGAEGPGKSILWEHVVKAIYGKYGVTIGQAQLDSQYTGWQSAKLFALAEEVVNRAERSHHKGKLKHLVTGSTFVIEEKFMPAREETNHLNFVFLSNSMVPLELDYGDRRYMVIRCDYVPAKKYFDDLFAEIESGGVECFYHFLLSLNLHDFGPHTKPIMNEEKSELIRLSMASPLHFVHLWRDGEIDMPYGPATTGDLFKAFQRWAERNGEFKRTERYFAGEIKREVAQVRKDIEYPQERSMAKTCRIWIPNGSAVTASSPGTAIGEACRRFYAALTAHTGGEGA